MAWAGDGVKVAKAFAESDDYAGFSATMRRELAPRGLVEELLVEMAIRSAWAWLRRSGLTDRAGRWLEGSLVRALENLDRLRRRRGRRDGPTRRGRAEGVASCPPRPVDDLRVDSERGDRLAPVHVEGLGVDDNAAETVAGMSGARNRIGEEDRRWRQRLAFDPSVSETSPVVRGTWITASQVVSRIVDGWSWAEILRHHPELTEEDIRACLAYTVEDEEGLRWG
jgi:uncharacterized protein (DUF433 family)